MRQSNNLLYELNEVAPLADLYCGPYLRAYLQYCRSGWSWQDREVGLKPLDARQDSEHHHSFQCSMEDSFDVGALAGEAKVLFNHETAQAHFGASVFWMRRLSALDGEQATTEYWQMKRDGTKRGIVDLILEAL